MDSTLPLLFTFSSGFSVLIAVSIFEDHSENTSSKWLSRGPGPAEAWEDDECSANHGNPWSTCHELPFCCWWSLICSCCLCQELSALAEIGRGSACQHIQVLKALLSDHCYGLLNESGPPVPSVLFASSPAIMLKNWQGIARGHHWARQGQHGPSQSRCGQANTPQEWSHLL